MENKREGRQLIIIVLLVLNLVAVSAGSGYLFQAVTLSKEEKPQSAVFEEQTDREYVLYIGLNDKDTYRQIIPTGEAIERIDTICVRYVDGYTLTEAQGGWVDEKGVMTQENTLVYYFRGADETEIKRIMDEVLRELNQNSILLEEKTVNYAYYSGGNGEVRTDDKDGE